MTTLALEFSSDRRSVAVARGGEVLAEAMEQTASRGTKAFALVEKVLADAKMSREEIEVVAIGLGPGSYTGIRAAIAIAQGWQLAREVKLLGVNSADALAAQAQAEKIFGRVNVVIDAQRGEFYAATWEISGAKLTALSPLKIVAGTELASLKGSSESCVGPEMEIKIFPTATMIARLASGRTDYLPGEKLEPIYLRETSFVKAPPARLEA